MLLTGAASPPPHADTAGAEVELRIEGLRSAKGMLRACLTRDARFFPHCERDPASLRINAPTSGGNLLVFRDVAQGGYAITVLHDEDGNGKIAMMLGIPREGVGFSNNPRIIAGPPSFSSARFAVADRPVEQTVRIRYFL